MRPFVLFVPIGISALIALAVLGPVPTVRVTASLCLLAMPLALSMWALLDIARRPRWVWALAERAQVHWMGAVMVGVLFVPLGLVVSLVYLTTVRPRLRAVEAGIL